MTSARSAVPRAAGRKSGRASQKIIMHAPASAAICVHAPAAIAIADRNSAAPRKRAGFSCGEKCFHPAYANTMVRAMRIKNAEKGARNNMLGNTESMCE